jgi:hypothetical protein
VLYSLSATLILAVTYLDAEPLKLANVHATYGVRGPTRPDNRVLPGDQFVLTFDIEGISVDETGNVLYSMATEVADSTGKLIHRQDPRDLKAVIALGGHSVPASASFDIGPNAPPGEYQVKVKVTDRAKGQSQELTQSVQVLPAEFGIVHLRTTGDEEGHASTCVFGTGEAMHVNYDVVGFARAAGGQPHVVVDLRVLDERNEPTLAKPFTGEIPPSDAHSLPAHFIVFLNRPGRFSVVLTAVDKVANKRAEVVFPLRVVPSRD